MSTGILQRHPALRWLAPVGAAGVVGVVAAGVLTAHASSGTTRLPTVSAAALISAAQRPSETAFSGTVVSQSSLGLPQLPSFGEASSSTSFASLLTGSHTMQVFYGGPGEQRLALLGSTDETDVFHDGRQFWEWDSSTRTAQHAVLPVGWQRAAALAAGADGDPTQDEVTPAALTRTLLAALEPSTQVSVQHGLEVADRPAYALVLRPRTTSTRVGSVRIALDGATKLPLGVQVYARGATSPALDVSFTSIRFGRPAESNFRFTPPAGATVHELSTGANGVLSAFGSTRPQPGRYVYHGSYSPSGDSRTPATRVTGAGWTRIVEIDGRSGFGGRDPLDALRASGVYDQLTPVSGSWGQGRLLETPLFCALLTDDARVYAGSVDPDALYAAAAKH